MTWWVKAVLCVSVLGIVVIALAAICLFWVYKKSLNEDDEEELMHRSAKKPEEVMKE